MSRLLFKSNFWFGRRTEVKREDMFSVNARAKHTPRSACVFMANSPSFAFDACSVVVQSSVPS